MIRNKSYYAVVLRQLSLKKDQAKPIDFELVFEHRHRNHPVMLCKLVRTYLDVNVEYRRLIFYWGRIFKMKGVVGAEKGFLSEEALVLIMLSFLQKNFHLSKAQVGIPEEQKRDVKKEMPPDNNQVNWGYAFSLKGEQGKQQLNALNETGKLKTRHNRVYLQADYTFIDDAGELRKKVDKFKKFTQNTMRRKTT